MSTAGIRGYLPQWPDCVIVQDTNLVHPAPTVHTFNKPEKRGTDLNTNYTFKSLKEIWFIVLF